MYERLKIISIEEVFQAIRENKNLRFGGEIRPPFSDRIMTYYVHGVQCVWEGCPCKGEYFGVERQVHRKTGVPYTKGYHLNLYGFNADGQEIMITSDHKIPKSQGGKKNGVANRQPMCQPHNQLKSNQLIYTE